MCSMQNYIVMVGEQGQNIYRIVRILINKLHTGNILNKTRNLPNEKLYNAFIMPYNKENNMFMLDSNVGNIEK